MSKEGVLGKDMENQGNLNDDSFNQTYEIITPEYLSPDPLVSSQWHLSRIGTLGFNGTTASTAGIERVWNEYTGEGVHVGIWDSGVQSSHWDLNDNYDSSRHVTIGGTLNDGQPIDGSNRHGTSVAGLIAAENNGQGGVGVAYDASITSVRIFGGADDINANWSRYLLTLDSLKNFDVTNHSYGIASPSFATYGDVAKFELSADLGRDGLGTINVKSAGNGLPINGTLYGVDGNGNGLDASRFTVSVAATSSTGNATTYSNYGAHILVSASAASVTTDMLGTTDGYNGLLNGDYTNIFGGTSASAPVTAGVISLMLDANEALGWRDVQNILAYSSIGTGSLYTGVTTNENFSWKWTGADNWNGGALHYSEDYGYGMVNAYNAVRMAEAWSIFHPVAATSSNEAVVGTGTIYTNKAINDYSTLNYSFSIAENISLEHVDLTLGLTHTNFTNLNISLISPDGTVMSIYDHSTGSTSTADYGLTYTFGVDGMRGEGAAGVWMLQIQDVVGGDVGSLNSLNFTGYGAAITNNSVYHYTNEMLTVLSQNGQGDRILLTDADEGSDWIDAAATSSDLVVDLHAGQTSTLGGTAFVTIDYSTLIENVIGGDGNDTLIGNEADNTIYGMRGNDSLNGGAGNDTYSFGLGYGIDVIDDYDGTLANVDVIRMGSGILASDVTVTRVGSNLTLSLNAGTDTLSINNWFQGDTYKIEQVQFADGTVWGVSDLESRATGSGDDYSADAGTRGYVTVDGTPSAGVLESVGDHDWFKVELAAGMEYQFNLNGSSLSDPYLRLYSPSGVLIVADDDGGDGLNSLITFRATETGTYYLDAGGFADGNTGAYSISATALGGGVIVGTEGDDILNGTAGHDEIHGLGGNDYLNGGLGDDRIYADAGNDLVIAGQGTDYVDGGEGVDTLVFDLSGRSDDLTINVDESANGMGNTHYSIDGYGSTTPANHVEADSFENVEILGGSGNDTINNGYNNLTRLTLNGGEGNDAINARLGDTVIVGQGFDTAIMYGSLVQNKDSLLIADYRATTQDIVITVVSEPILWSPDGMLHANINDGLGNGVDAWGFNEVQVIGGSGNDIISGGNAGEVLDGGSGDDMILAGAGNDTVIAGQGWDYADGGEGVDTLVFDLSARTDSLTINVEAYDSGGDSAHYTIDSYSNIVSLPTPNHVEADEFERVEILGGSSYDTINGYNNTSSEILNGGLGNDTINAGAGDTVVVGQGWDDVGVVGPAGKQSTLVVDYSYATQGLSIYVSSEEILSPNGKEINLNVNDGFGNGANAWRFSELHVQGGSGNDMIVDGVASAVLGGGLGDDQVMAGGGNDTVVVGQGADFADGGEGVDTLVFDLSERTDDLTINIDSNNYGNGTHYSIDSYSNTMPMPSHVEADGFEQVQVIGGSGNDTINGYNNTTSEILNGGVGHDTINAGVGDTVVVGQGWDNAYGLLSQTEQTTVVADFSYATQGLTINVISDEMVAPIGTEIHANINDGLGNGTDAWGFNEVQIIGGAGNDVINGGNAGETINGGAGFDQIFAGAGNDTVITGQGHDMADGGEGVDTLVFDLSERVDDQTITAQAYNNGDGVQYGIESHNTYGVPNPIPSHLDAYDFERVEIIGSLGSDIISGTMYAETIDGNAGNDTITAGAGNDTVITGQGWDVSDGGEGTDALVFDLSYSADVNQIGMTISAKGDGSYEYILYASDEQNTIFSRGNSFENIQVIAGAGNDNIQGAWDVEGDYGSFADKTIDGGGGDDSISSGVGNDIIYGGEGNDWVDAGIGNDTVIAGQGHDTADGGEGVDTLVFDLSERKDDLTINIDSNNYGNGTHYSIDSYSNTMPMPSHVEADGFEQVQVIGGSGNDTINGSAYGETLSGEAGNDRMFGSAGDDIYRLKSGGGADTISDFDQTAGNFDNVEFTDIVSTAVTATLRVGENLVIQYGATDQVTVENYFNGSGNFIVEQFKFSDGITWDHAKIVEMLNTAPVGEVIIIGVPVQGETLSAINTLSDPDGVGEVTYTWMDGEGEVLGVGETLALTQSHVDKSISVTATYEDGYGTVESVSSQMSTRPVANVNDAPVGDVLIMGMPEQGQMLIATNMLTDLDGIMTPINYLWTDAQGNMLGMGETLMLTQEHVGQSIQVTASYVDNYGTLEQVTSVLTPPVANVNDAPVGDVLIMGMPEQGQMLIATNMLTDLDGIMTPINYLWTDAQGNMLGMGETLMLTQEHVGQSIQVTASYVDNYGTLEQVTSVLTPPVANVNDAPVGDVLIMGMPEQGQMLIATNMLTDLDGIMTPINYLWTDAQGNMLGMGETLMLTQEHVGQSIQVTASYVDNYGTLEQVTSVLTPPVANINDAPEGEVIITGLAQQGQMLTVSNTLTDADGMGDVAYTWIGEAGNVLGVGETLVLTQSHVGQSINVMATYEDGYHTEESVRSMTTTPVQNVNDAPVTTEVVMPGTQEDSGVRVITQAELLANASDIDGDTLAATNLAIISGNGTLVDKGDGTWEYTPAQDDDASVSFSYTVSDGTETVAGSAALDITPINDAPTTDEVTLVAIAEDSDVRVITQAELLANASDIDGDTLAATNLAIISGNGTLEDKGDGTWEYTPAQDDDASVSFSYTVSDGTETVAGSATLDITPVNDVPVAQPIATQFVSEDAAFSFAIPEGTFADVDANDALTVSAQLADGSVWPSWLVFDPVAQIFSGTPTSTAAGVYNIGVIATDLTGESVTTQFVLDVANHMVGTSSGNTLTGTALRDVIEGLAGADIINGGLGADTLIGGTGNDTYTVDNIDDVVTEASASGTDTVNTGVSYTLSDNVEKLTLTGTSAINGTGNSLANTLTGNSADNILIGGAGVDTMTGNAGNDTLDGGAGNDTMTGGSGNDTYYVDSTSDTVTESSSSGGTDTIISIVTRTLGSYQENLSLEGPGNVNGTGNSLNNVIIGNAGNNTLSGSSGLDTLNGGAGNDILNGGADHDVLIGGTGADIFLFNSTLSVSNNTDVIQDFTSGTDLFHIDNSVFTRLTTTGTLSADAFHIGAAAHDASDRIIFNADTGDLYYDRDGSGSGTAVKFATLVGVETLTNTDFIVI